MQTSLTQKVNASRSPYGQRAPEYDLSGIDLDQLRSLLKHPVINELLEEPKESPSLDLKQVPSRAEMTLIPTDLLFNRPTREEQKGDPNVVLNYEATALKEEMLGYVDAIVQRQDRADCMKKMETFDVENASRRVLSSLMEHFRGMHVDMLNKCAHLEKEQKRNQVRMDELDHANDKLRSDMERVDKVQANIHKVEVTHLNHNQLHYKEMNELKAKVQESKTTLESKIDKYATVSETVALHEEQLQQFQRFLFDTKELLYSELNKMRDEFKDSVVTVNTKATELSHNILDVKYWIEQYNDSFKKADAKFNNLRTEMLTEFQKVQRDVDSKCATSDLQTNFKELSDMLCVKFKQVEDVKEAVRDMITYQKFFYPIQVQTTISENMQHFRAAKQDHDFLKFQQERFDSMMDALEAVKDKCEKMEDADIK